MPYYFNLALDNGVKPREISEIITHLAFYSGWANAMSAVAVAKDVFANRKLGADQLPPASPSLLPLDQGRGSETRCECGTAVWPRSLPELCSTPLMFCSVTFGCVPILLREIGVSSLSALSIASGQVAQIHIPPKTGRWITG